MGLQQTFRRDTEIEDEFGFGPYDAPLESVRVISRLRELPPGPYRSLGKHLNYTDWPDRQRFLELDQDIQRRAQEFRDHGGYADPDELPLPGDIIPGHIRRVA
jgi:hypothetical protein